MARIGIAAALGLGLLVGPASAEDFELAPVRYSEATPADPVALLSQAIAKGEAPPVAAPDEPGYVRNLLSRLNIPVESQSLVFSKTSLQRNRISPQNPRALFFNDEVYVGWVPGADVEIISFDKDIGPVFYQITVPEMGQNTLYYRADSCLSCHVNVFTGRVPGLLMRSVVPDKNGLPVGHAGTFQTTPQSLFAERWGGWFVTGHHAASRPMSNAFLNAPEDKLDREAFANLDALDAIKHFDAKRYLYSRSDAVALLVLEHQVAMHNILTEANMQSRLAIYRWQGIQSSFEPEASGRELTGSALSVVRHYALKIIAQMLFAGVTDWPENGIQGDEGFQKVFLAARKADDEGHSLRDFDLKTRLFRNRCSYLIYSASFSGLPPELKDEVLARLEERLLEPEKYAESAHLDIPECKRIRSILKQTRPDR